jgi:hypothetical protein
LILSDKNLCAINPARENFIASLFCGKNPKSATVFLILKGMSMLSLFIDGDIPHTNKKMLEKLNQLRFWSAV